MDKRLKLAMCAAALLAAAGAHAGEASVTPYRPSVSTPAQLPTPGQLEFELGALSAHDEGVRTSLPYQLKLAFNQEWGVLVGGDAWVAMRDADGTRARGAGKTSVVLKHAILMSEATAFGVELGAALPTGSRAIADDASDWTLNTVWSQDFGALHLDANLNRTWFGQPDAGAARAQDGAAAAFSTSLNERWTATAELSGTHQRGAQATTQLLAAMSYAPNKALVIDAGVSKGLRAGARGWSLFTGFVMPLAQLW